jgi:hypothetical protein
MARYIVISRKADDMSKTWTEMMGTSSKTAKSFWVEYTVDGRSEGQRVKARTAAAATKKMESHWGVKVTKVDE